MDIKNASLQQTKDLNDWTGCQKKTNFSGNAVAQLHNPFVRVVHSNNNFKIAKS